MAKHASGRFSKLRQEVEGISWILALLFKALLRPRGAPRSRHCSRAPEVRRLGLQGECEPRQGWWRSWWPTRGIAGGDWENFQSFLGSRAARRSAGSGALCPAGTHSANGCAMRRPAVTRAAPVEWRLERTPCSSASTRTPRPRSLARLPASLPTVKAPRRKKNLVSKQKRPQAPRANEATWPTARRKSRKLAWWAGPGVGLA